MDATKKNVTTDELIGAIYLAWEITGRSNTLDARVKYVVADILEISPYQLEELLTDEVIEILFF